MVFDYLVDFLTMMFVLMLFVASIFSPRPGNRRSRRMRRMNQRQVADVNGIGNGVPAPAGSEAVVAAEGLQSPPASFGDDSKGTPSPA